MSPIQVYACAIDGEFDIPLRFVDVIPASLSCPMCMKLSKHVIKAPAGIVMKRTWNERANSSQSDAYTQAKTQAENTYASQKALGHKVERATEKGIQLAAEQIAKKPTPKNVGPHIDSLKN